MKIRVNNKRSEYIFLIRNVISFLSRANLRDRSSILLIANFLHTHTNTHPRRSSFHSENFLSLFSSVNYLKNLIDFAAIRCAQMVETEGSLFFYSEKICIWCRVESIVIFILMNEEINSQVFIKRGIYDYTFDPDKTRKKYKRSGERGKRILKAYKVYNSSAFSSQYRIKLNVK